MLRSKPEQTRPKLTLPLGARQQQGEHAAPCVPFRTDFGGDIYRVLFCLDDATMVLLHGFKKKSRRTPKPDLDLARKRQRTLEDDS